MVEIPPDYEKNLLWSRTMLLEVERMAGQFLLALWRRDGAYTLANAGPGVEERRKRDWLCAGVGEATCHKCKHC